MLSLARKAFSLCLSFQTAPTILRGSFLSRYFTILHERSVKEDRCDSDSLRGWGRIFGLILTSRGRRQSLATWFLKYSTVPDRRSLLAHVLRADRGVKSRSLGPVCIRTPHANSCRNDKTEVKKLIVTGASVIAGNGMQWTVSQYIITSFDAIVSRGERRDCFPQCGPISCWDYRHDCSANCGAHILAQT
jgi:hypothetical protein